MKEDNIKFDNLKGLKEQMIFKCYQRDNRKKDISWLFTAIIVMMLCFHMNEYKTQIYAEEVSVVSDVEQTNNVEGTNAVSLNVPSKFKGTSNKEGIKLSWKNKDKVNGFILFRNGKKLKNLKNEKTSYIDKNVNLNRKYIYQILAYKNIDGKKVRSEKSYKISVLATDSKSKKLNVARFTNIKNQYKLGIGESKKLNPTVNFSNKIKGKEARKKKVYSKKIEWSSSNPELVQVDQKGKITAASDKSIGTAKIYARAHNGQQKEINVTVVNYANLGKIKNLRKVDEEVIRKLLTTDQDRTSKIAEYFEYHNPGKAVELCDDVSKLTYDDEYGQHEMCFEENYDVGKITIPYEDGNREYFIQKSSEIEIEKEMYEFILQYLIDNDVRIKVDENYVYFQKRHPYSYGDEFFDLVYVFNGKNALKKYQYSNAVYNVMPVADRWYYGISHAYAFLF